MAESGRSAHGDYERRSSSPRTASKRKYEEPVEPPPRQQQQHRPPPLPPAPESQRPSYKSVPPPLSDFELAKQRAEQIAARLVGDEFKRARTITDDNDGVASNVERGHYGHQDDRQSADFYAQHQTKRVDVPNTKVGLVIGKGGETIRTLQQQSGAKIQVTRDAETDPGSMTRQVELTGTPEQISRAEQLIREVVGDQGIVGGPVMGAGAGAGAGAGGVGEPIHVRVPNNKVGLIIGKGGETIRNLQQSSGARIQVQHDRETEPGATERIVTLVGTKQQTDIATDMIKDVIGEGRSRGGGYQQGGYRPPQAWSGQSQSGYGYQQQGYGSQQYGGYAGWDQNQQQGSYEYYQNSEGGAQAAEGDPNYNYGQQGYYYDQQAYEQQYPQGYDQSGAYNQQQGGYNQEEYPAGYGYEYDQYNSYDQSGQYAQGEGGAAAANAAPAAAAAATTPAAETYSQQPPPASSSAAAQTAHT